MSDGVAAQRESDHDGGWRLAAGGVGGHASAVEGAVEGVVEAVPRRDEA
ncbi:hypothetical protein [Mycobacterium sp. D16R24]|nr:hypothetical protein [Mycobacterium sp. D16R24]